MSATLDAGVLGERLDAGAVIRTRTIASRRHRLPPSGAGSHCGGGGARRSDRRPSRHRWRHPRLPRGRRRHQPGVTLPGRTGRRQRRDHPAARLPATRRPGPGPATRPVRASQGGPRHADRRDQRHDRRRAHSDRHRAAPPTRDRPRPGYEPAPHHLGQQSVDRPAPGPSRSSGPRDVHPAVAGSRPGSRRRPRTHPRS